MQVASWNETGGGVGKKLGDKFALVSEQLLTSDIKA